MQNSKLKLIRFLCLVGGLLQFIFISINTENDLVYACSPWLYIGFFLFYTRTVEKKSDWFFFVFVYLTVNEIRYAGFLGQTGEYFNLYSMLLIVVVALVTLIPFVIDSFYLKFGKGIFKLLAFPITRVIMERFLVGRQFNLFLTQFGNKLLVQVAALFGDIFITFIVAFVPSAIVYMILEKDNKPFKRTALLSLLFCTVIMVLGGMRYFLSKRPNKSVLMAYASGPQKTYYENPSEDDADISENLEYLDMTVEKANEKNAKVMVYAEEAFIVEGDEEDKIIEEAKKLAKENGIFILICLDVSKGETENYNKAVFIDDKGEFLSEYIKSYLIPVVEDSEYVEGDGVIPSNHVTIDGEDYVISYSICYDATFSDYLLTMDKKTDLYINPSWDWEEIDDLNYRLQGVSAVEGGVTLFKPTVDGVSMVCDPFGKISYKENTIGLDYNSVHFVNVSKQRTVTLYRHIYKYVIYLWSIIAGVLLIDMTRIIVKLVKRKKQEKLV